MPVYLTRSSHSDRSRKLGEGNHYLDDSRIEGQKLRTIGMIVTAIMITRSSRIDLVRQSIKCFRNQIYPHKRLLMVASPVEELAEFKTQKDILLVEGPEDATLGELRNIALENCTPGFAIQWDDDDLYGPHRIGDQLEPFIENKSLDATMLSNQLVLVGEDFYLRCVDDGIAGTIMHRVPIANRYPLLRKGEDTVFLEEFEKNRIVVQNNRAGNYVRRYHGNNTWDYMHFKSICGQKLTMHETENFLMESEFTI